MSSCGILNFFIVEAVFHPPTSSQALSHWRPRPTAMPHRPSPVSTYLSPPHLPTACGNDRTPLVAARRSLPDHQRGGHCGPEPCHNLCWLQKVVPGVVCTPTEAGKLVGQEGTSASQPGHSLKKTGQGEGLWKIGDAAPWKVQVLSKSRGDIPIAGTGSTHGVLGQGYKERFLRGWLGGQRVVQLTLDWPWAHLVVQAGLKLQRILLDQPKTGIRGVHHHTQVMLLIFSERQQSG